MSARCDTSKPARREIFVLTPEEKKTICFVIIAFIFGLATKYYRDKHPAAPSTPTPVVRGHSVPKPSATARP